jgi:hypothetical protein
MDEIHRAYREVLAACLEEHPGRSSPFGSPLIRLAGIFSHKRRRY